MLSEQDRRCLQHGITTLMQGQPLSTALLPQLQAELHDITHYLLDQHGDDNTPIIAHLLSSIITDYCLTPHEATNPQKLATAHHCLHLIAKTRHSHLIEHFIECCPLLPGLTTTAFLDLYTLGIQDPRQVELKNLQPDDIVRKIKLNASDYFFKPGAARFSQLLYVVHLFDALQHHLSESVSFDVHNPFLPLMPYTIPQNQYSPKPQQRKRLTVMNYNGNTVINKIKINDCVVGGIQHSAFNLDTQPLDSNTAIIAALFVMTQGLSDLRFDNIINGHFIDVEEFFCYAVPQENKQSNSRAHPLFNLGFLSQKQIEAALSPDQMLAIHKTCEFLNAHLPVAQPASLSPRSVCQSPSFFNDDSDSEEKIPSKFEASASKHSKAIQQPTFKRRTSMLISSSQVTCLTSTVQTLKDYLAQHLDTPISIENLACHLSPLWSQQYQQLKIIITAIHINGGLKLTLKKLSQRESSTSRRSPTSAALCLTNLFHSLPKSQQRISNLLQLAGTPPCPEFNIELAINNTLQGLACLPRRILPKPSMNQLKRFFNESEPAPETDFYAAATKQNH